MNVYYLANLLLAGPNQNIAIGSTVNIKVERWGVKIKVRKPERRKP